MCNFDYAHTCAGELITEEMNNLRMRGHSYTIALT